ncbi:methylated-DNA--[protein]-cysteine S-methyltransferase [Sphaerobacter sp.]|uniref:methylated-DNA--[protein]-cysteine S-methyltransferase n=1 Tax=Sphaerobacter sp. TaxID=2099654 RepID=UPI001D5048CF|nr:methylated-DNA--[protein]-cysteine S-methyltransferase [Sphaerobacter sp.]MBX5446368.1 methylated-DNA--[protein]-cysteine S-methyltransferase [Sphaerobacter sp.]
MQELNCTDVVERIPALVAGDLNPEEVAAIDRHTATCASCAREVAQGRALAGLLDQVAARTAMTPGERLLDSLPTVAYDWIDSPVGPLLVAVSPRGLCRVDYGGTEAEIVAWAESQRLVPRHDPDAVRPYVTQLQEYFAGARQHFDLPVDLTAVSPFTRRVLEVTAQVPFGRLVTYRDIARTIGQPGATRAVGNALGSNPVPIVVPCHRVVRSDGTIGGYTGGLAIKWHLLAIEGVTLPAV